MSKFKPQYLPDSKDDLDYGRKQEGRVTQEREYRLLTPLFGGGVTAGENDLMTPIRGTEVRGHLRFWWRATQAGRFASIKAMKEAEDKLWGTTSTPKKSGASKVDVLVDQVTHGGAFQATDHRDNNVDIGHYRSRFSYVAFPLEDRQTVLKDVQFRLTITFPTENETYRPGIEAALWAWETFGGIGARTRRGFGTLSCTNIQENDQSIPVSRPQSCRRKSVEDYLRINLQKHVVAGQSPPELTHLHPTMPVAITPFDDDPVECWLYLINKLKDFRQDRRGRFGRSKWPEPDEIRRLTGQTDPRHSRPVSSVRKFPRGKFGLPIIFQFKDADSRKPDNPNADPRQTSLQGRGGYERFASPLILRPLLCHGQQAVGIAAVLAGPDGPPKGLELDVQKSSRSFPVDADVAPAEARAIPPLGGKQDILQAFLDTI